MKKLTYQKIANSVIEIDLQNGYNVSAIVSHNKKENIYIVSLYLRDTETTLYDLMGDFEQIKIENATDTNIYSVILREVSFLLANKMFDKYFERYEYMLLCFDLGNQLFETERLGDK